MSDFTQQIALVSGATRGIGKAIAEKLINAGAFVWAIYGSNEAAANSFANEHASFSSQFELVRCDISKDVEVLNLYQQIEEKHGSLDILINNAGIRRDAIVAMMKTEQWQQVIDINLTGTFFMAKQAILLMLKKRYGRIINITSPIAYLGFAGQANYAASKAGQIAMSKSLAKEVAKKKITVNCVSPGFIETDFIADLPESQMISYKKMVPMKRFGSTEEVADAVLFLAGKSASYITGATLNVDGGI